MDIEPVCPTAELSSLCIRLHQYHIIRYLSSVADFATLEHWVGGLRLEELVSTIHLVYRSKLATLGADS